MQGVRVVFAAALSLSLVTLPAWAAPTTALGTIVAAEKAHVGQAVAGVGTTVFGGDQLSTETLGSVQVRAGAARLLLSGASSAMVNDSQGMPSAKLVAGTVTFSTGNARAFTLYASTAVIRAASDAPTIGQVTYVSDKELVVRAARGGVVVSIEDETQVIPEGTAYRVLLDPDPAQGPAGAGTGGGGKGGRGGPALRAGRSRFLIMTAVAVGVVTYFFVDEALESASRP